MSEQVFHCDKCSFVSRYRNGLAVHRQRMHGIVSRAKVAQEELLDLLEVATWEDALYSVKQIIQQASAAQQAFNNVMYGRAESAERAALTRRQEP